MKVFILNEDDFPDIKLCGDAHVIMINAREFVDLSMKFLESMELKYLACSEETRNWVKKIYSLSGGNL